ncbi:hypothetical protein NMA58_30240 (plasmid) [Rhizobium sp. YTUHZ045]|uniref:hypothetical protein n=1 Tax=Rhizobium TaxID=379 RepID=UPI0039F6FF55
MQAGRRRGVSYVVDGSVRTDADTVRIGAKLVDVSSGRILWTGTYDRKLTAASLLDVQGEIAAEVATVLGQPYGVVHNDETSHLPRDITPSMPSYECVLQAYAYRRSFTRVLYGPVQTCLEAAVKRDPDYAEAWAMLGWTHLDTGRFGWTADGNLEREYNLALDAASHAVTLNGRSVLALKALSSINHYMGNFEEGERIQRRALSLNHNDPDTLAQLGWRLAVRGKFADGIPYLKQAIDRTVNPPGWYFHLVSIDHYLNGRYAEMLNAAKNGTVDGSGVSWSLVAIAQGALGNEAAARDALERMAAVAPALNRDPAAVYRRHQATEDIVDALVKGLRNAGWRPPESH